MLTPTRIYAWISMIIIAGLIYFSFESIKPSIESLNSEQATYFSVEKAYDHLDQIAGQPHYTGSSDHAVVQSYLVKELEKMGLEVQLQKGAAMYANGTRATKVTNVIGELKAPGKGIHKKLLLMSHYDSATHSSLGASDAGSGVVVILEILRAFIEENAEFSNDILVVFTDAEEIGLLGAERFVHSYDRVEDIGLVVNFEARGSGGTSYMFMETNDFNQKLFLEFNKAEVETPVANSLMYSIYKLLPNDTDLTVIRENGDIPGFNFAFIGDHFDYHTVQDNVARMDESSLIHQADYLSHTLRYFAKADLSNLSGGQDEIYVNFPGIKMLHYPESWSIPLLVLAYVIFLVLVFLGLGHGRLSVGGIMRGFIPLFSSLVIGFGVSAVGWRMLLNIYPQYRDILHGFTYNGYDYITAFMFITLGLTLSLYSQYFKKEDRANILVAPLFFWMFLNFILLIFLPGGAFLIIPVYFGLASLYVVLFRSQRKFTTFIALALLAAPALFIIMPFLRMFPVGLGLKALGIASVFLVLVVSLLLGLLNQFKHRRYLIFMSFTIGLLFMVKASFHADYSLDQKKPNSLNYVFDQETGKSFWETYDGELDAYSSQVIKTQDLQGSSLESNKNGKYDRGIRWRSEAPDLKLPSPIVSYDMDSLGFVNLKLKSSRGANRFDLRALEKFSLDYFEVNHRNVEDSLALRNLGIRDRLSLYLLENPDDSLELKFRTKQGIKPKLELIEASYDLLDNNYIQLKPREPYMMPTPFVLNDAMIYRMSIE